MSAMSVADSLRTRFDIAEAIPVAVGAPMSTDERKMEEEEEGEEKVAEEAKSETKPKKVIVVGGSRSSADGHPAAKRNLFKTKVNAVMNPTSLRCVAFACAFAPCAALTLTAARLLFPLSVCFPLSRFSQVHGTDGQDRGGAPEESGGRSGRRGGPGAGPPRCRAGGDAHRAKARPGLVRRLSSV